MEENVKQKKELSDTKICCFMYGLVLLMFVVLSSPLSISYILDETGTVANAAFLAGENWNDWVNSTGGYFYKYGQSIFYYPIMKLATNPYIMYKLFLIVNGAFVALIPVMSYQILRRHLHQEDKLKCTLTSLCLAVVPAVVLYSLFARAEAMLISLAWVTLYTVLENMNAKDMKQKVLWSLLVAFISVYMYMCHSRGIVFVIAIFMVMFGVRFILKNKNICFTAYLIGTGIWLFVDKHLTRYFKNSIWGEGVKKNTLEKVNVDKYDVLFTADGLDTIVKNATGWLFNSFLGTFGLVLLGLAFATVLIVMFFRKKDVDAKELVISVYAFLIYFGTMAMGALFSFKSNYNFVIGEKVKRADRFLYSRYLAPTYAIIIFIALFYLFYKKNVFGWKTKLATVLIGGGLIVYCRTWLKDFVNDVEYSWRNTIDSAMFFDTVRYGNDANSYSNVSRALLQQAVLAFAVLALVLLLTHYHEKIKMQSLVIVLIGGCMLVSLTTNYKKLRLFPDMRPMMAVASCINQLEEIEDETQISELYDEIYVDKSISRYKMMQLAFPNFTVHVRKSLEPEEVKDMFILCASYHVDEGWMGDDCYIFKDFDYDNERSTVVVKGEGLKQELEKAGYELIAIPDEYGDMSNSKPGVKRREAFVKSLKYQWESVQ